LDFSSLAVGVLAAASLLRSVMPDHLKSPEEQ